MSLLLRKLLGRFLTLPVVEGDPAADTGADPAADPAPVVEDTLDDLLGAAGDDPAPRETDPAPAPRPSANEERLSRELETERAVRRALETRAAPAPATPAHDAEYDAEERRLADARARGVDANSIGWMEWQIRSDRANRETRRHADNTLRETRDIADQTAFERLESTKPQVFKRYKDRVEAEVTRLRAQGQNAPRLAILRYLIGDDAVNGKIGTKASKPAAPATPAPSNTVDRGRTPGTRTDVTGRGGSASEREKRRERLRNVPL